MSSPKILLPWSLSLGRVGLAPVVVWAIQEYRLTLALILILIAVLSDLLDGYLARKLKATTPQGAYLDVGADFILLLACFGAFAQNGLYGWLPAVMVLMFAQFVLTSRGGRLVYDPVGKYYGAVLYGVALLSLALPDEVLCQGLYLGVLMLSGVSLSSRFMFHRATTSRG